MTCTALGAAPVWLRYRHELPYRRGGNGSRSIVYETAGARFKNSRLAHAHEAAVVLTRQRPQESAHIGTFIKEADRVEMHARLAVEVAVPIGLQLLPHGGAQAAANVHIRQLAGFDLFRRHAFAEVGNAVRKKVDRVQTLRPQAESRLHRAVHIGTAVGFDGRQRFEDEIGAAVGIEVKPVAAITEREYRFIGKGDDLIFP